MAFSWSKYWFKSIAIDHQYLSASGGLEVVWKLKQDSWESWGERAGSELPAQSAAWLVMSSLDERLPRAPIDWFSPIRAGRRRSGRRDHVVPDERRGRRAVAGRVVEIGFQKAVHHRRLPVSVQRSHVWPPVCVSYLQYSTYSFKVKPFR